MPDLIIRDAEPRDCPAIADIYNEAIKVGRSTMDTQAVDGSRFHGYLDDPRTALLAGVVGSELVAWAIVKPYSDRPGYRFAGETSIYVAGKHQDDGHGSVLFDSAMMRARSLRYRHVVAKVLAVNADSIRFLERFDFELVGRQRAIGYLNGAWHDVVIMQRIFDQAGPDVPDRESRQ